MLIYNDVMLVSTIEHSLAEVTRCQIKAEENIYHVLRQNKISVVCFV